LLAGIPSGKTPLDFNFRKISFFLPLSQAAPPRLTAGRSPSVVDTATRCAITMFCTLFQVHSLQARRTSGFPSRRCFPDDLGPSSCVDIRTTQFFFLSPASEPISPPWLPSLVIWSGCFLMLPFGALLSRLGGL